MPRPAGREETKVSRMLSSCASREFSRLGSLTLQPFWGSRRMRAPLAARRLSLRLKLEADAHASYPRSATGKPDARIVDFNSWTAAASRSTSTGSG
ncbi:hypothetical protein [Streptomyces sp. MNU77]|uniref:hypothetical protein n=1 Tax=Streptomyces sp. MNU77 TaxID=1573406 RepID=UPI00355696B4